MFCIFKTFPFF